MTDEQRADLQVHVGMTAWSAWSLLPFEERVDLDAALRVYAGNLRLVAAHLLRDLADRTPDGQAGVKRVKVGPIEVELRSEAGTDARTTWLTRAERLEKQADAGTRITANPAPVFEPWGIG